MRKKFYYLIWSLAMVFATGLLIYNCDVKAASYKCSLDNDHNSVMIGKTKYAIKGNGNKIVMKKNGKTKTLIRTVATWSFVTNGKYIYYQTSKKKGYYIGNYLYKYNIKTKKKKYIFKVNKSYSVVPIAKKGRYLYYPIWQSNCQADQSFSGSRDGC